MESTLQPVYSHRRCDPINTSVHSDSSLRAISNVYLVFQAYTILESSTNSIFLHVTLSEPPNPAWGNIVKSNSNGTYFGLSMDYVNRDDRGYVDFEKMIGLDGIAIINIVSNPSDAFLTGKKELQTRIRHNDGWWHDGDVLRCFDFSF